MADLHFDTVISLTDARQSALLYEHVIPLLPFNLALPKRDPDNARILFYDLAPDSLKTQYMEYSAAIECYYREFVAVFLQLVAKHRDFLLENNAELPTQQNPLVDLMGSFLI